jgi:uncharacterized protein YeaO (DUF488 family)
MGGKPDVRVRRVYDGPEPDDGTRVLVDRVWPRGLTKDRARLDQWFKQVAPWTAGRVSASVEKEDGRGFPMSSQLRRETHARARTSIACGAHPRPDRPALRRPVT